MDRIWCGQALQRKFPYSRRSPGTSPLTPVSIHSWSFYFSVENFGRELADSRNIAIQKKYREFKATFLP
jgi:hypothetical protein